MSTFELLDIKTIHEQHSFEQLQSTPKPSYHTMYINFIDFFMEVYKTYKYDISYVEKQVVLDVMRSTLYINKILIEQSNKVDILLAYCKRFHNDNYVKLLCLHTQAIYAKVLELLLKIINNTSIHIVELDAKDSRNKLIMNIHDNQSLYFISKKNLRIVRVDDMGIHNLYIVYIQIKYKFGDIDMDISYTINTY